jgi:Skp family chaperone for outer membrane proteins
VTIVLSAISFLTSAAGRYVLIGAVIFGALFAARQSGINTATRKCEAAALRQQLANTQTDLNAARTAAEASAAAMADSDARARENQQKANDYEAELKRRPNGACALTDDDLRVLRDDGKPRTR